MLKIRTSKSEIYGVKSQLKELQGEIESIRKEYNNFIALTKLFNLMSKLQDEKIFQEELNFLKKKMNKKFKKETKDLNDICGVIEMCGRDRFGMNRTNYGELCTFNNVFLGDVYGLRTHPISYWVKNEDAIKHEIISGIAGKPSIWEVLYEWQAGRFVKSNTKVLLSNINNFLLS